MRAISAILFLVSCAICLSEAVSQVVPEPRNVTSATIPEPRGDDPPIIPIPRVGEWQTFYLGLYGKPSALTLTSSKYPYSYTAGEDSRLMFYSPSGTVIDVSCQDFNVENSAGCTKDAFILSLTGRTDFQDGAGMCGAGTFRKTSTTNSLAIRFFSGSRVDHYTTFRFNCAISIQSAPAPVTTTTTTTTTARTTTVAASSAAASSGSSSSTCTCGARNQVARIVGGEYAQAHEFPWRCVLYTPNMGAFCGATIIDNEWILTAAHCTAAVKSGDTLYADCGDHQLNSKDDGPNQMITVDTIKQHAQYTTPSQNNDISLLHLSKPLTYSKNVSAVCLPWQSQGNQCKSPSTSVMASGWGTTSYKGSPSMTLKKVELPCMSSQQCRTYYGTAITDNMICTLKTGEDTCQGDSGGSIDYKDPNSGSYYAIGVVSWGDECAKANKPGVYTNVANYLSWIKSSTGKTFCGE